MSMCPPAVDPAALLRRMQWHVLWLPILLGIISIIDRANISYAALRMNVDLGFTATIYGFGAGILFIGYVIFEVPSNILMRKIGARKHLARIAVTWGIFSALTAFAWNDISFYVIRFLLGVAEAGLFPGVVLYLTYWFPAKSRATANALFMTAVPIANIIAAPISGWLVGLETIAGLRGWQFMFLFWGFPALVLAVVMLFLLPDTPDEAKWMTGAEREWLKGVLDEEAQVNVDAGRHRWGDGVKSWNVWVFSLIYICYGMCQYGMIFFLPQVLRRMQLVPWQIGVVGALPFLAGAITMVIVSRHSDRTGERTWHFTAPLLVAAVAIIAAALALNMPVLAVLLLIVAGGGLFAALGNFWARPTALLTGAAATIGFAVINSIGNLGGFIAPTVMGILQDQANGNSFTGLVFMSVVGFLGCALSLFAVRKGVGTADDITTTSPTV